MPASSKKSRPSFTVADPEHLRFCAVPKAATRAFDANVDPARAAAIITHAKKWVNGTELTYGFFAGPDGQKKAMRQAFDVWKKVGIGLVFSETSVDEAMIRIAFEDDGSWSNVGRDILTKPMSSATMNIGWSLAGDLDTGVHEIGHTLGLNHEHQNPNAGIVWNEEAVYEDLGGPPNKWPRDKTYYNIIRKLDPEEIRGSNWDPDSIMHYPFKKGLIASPEKYKNGLNPAGGLSAFDKAWVREFYPPLAQDAVQTLEPDKLAGVKATAGQQVDFTIQPAKSGVYDIRTFGDTDCVMVLFEKAGKKLKYLTADDDSGTEDNAAIKRQLDKGKAYVLRIRYMHVSPDTKNAVLLW